MIYIIISAVATFVVALLIIAIKSIVSPKKVENVKKLLKQGKKNLTIMLFTII